MYIFGDDFRHFWETLAQLLILQPRNLLRAMILESWKKVRTVCSYKSATQLVLFAGKNVLKKCGRGFGWGNGRGQVGWDWISHHIPITFSFPEILHATCVSTNTVPIKSLMHLSRIAECVRPILRRKGPSLVAWCRRIEQTDEQTTSRGYENHKRLYFTWTKRAQHSLTMQSCLRLPDTQSTLDPSQWSSAWSSP